MNGPTLVPRLNVLFVGNSFTARNNLPGLIAQLAAARGRSFEHRLISAGGASLRRHWNAGEALKAIASGRYDAVVLQEQSTLPVKSAKRMHESVRLFDAAIKAGVRLCGPLAWRDRPDFTCFQGGTELAAIAKGAKEDLGNLANTQGKPEVGPWAPH